MLFISPHPGYQLTGVIQAEEIYHEGTGRYLRTEPGVDAVFIHGGAPDWAAEQALANPTFQQLWGGLPDGVDRRLYIASYDTDKKAREENWDQADKDYVEEFLLNHPDFGYRYVLADAPEEVKALPWPNYDSTHHAQVVKVAKDIGVDLSYVLEYEQKHKNRPLVIERLTEAIGGQPDPVEDDFVAA